MNEAKFTKGPWKPNQYGELRNNENTQVTVWGLGIAWGPRSEEKEANSNLIAAAPEMYQMLNSLAAGEGLQPGQTIERLLAKARGEK